MRHLAVKFGKIHFITKYFDARWGGLVRVFLLGKPSRNFLVSLGELQPCILSFNRKLGSRKASKNLYSIPMALNEI